MTIKDIAKECGCGLGTVSRAINNKPGVKPETKKRILEVVEKHGFVLNSYAKQLKSQNNHLIAIFVKGAKSMMLTSMLAIIHKHLESLPYITNVIVLNEEENEVLAAHRIYYEKKPEGIIFLGGNLENFTQEFDKLKVPSVLISTEADSIKRKYMSSVSIDNISGAEAAGDYLFRLGHKNIGIIGGYLEHFGVTENRLLGFLRSIKKNEINFSIGKSYVPCKYSFKGGYDAVKVLMEKNPKITGILTMSDSMAIGAIRGLNDLGYKVPDDVSIIGFDGLPFVNFSIPRLTTVCQPIKHLALKGLEILLKNIKNNKNIQSEHILVPFNILESDSVRNLN